LQGAAQGGFFAGGGLLDFGVSAGLENDHLVPAGQAVHPLQRLGARGFKTRGRHVGGLHRSRGVEDDDAEVSGFDFRGEIRAGQREGGQRQQQNLQQQQPVAPEFLKGGARLGLREKLLPQQRA